MKIHNNVLSFDTIQAIRQETNRTRDHHLWRLSALSWGPDVQVGVQASVACRMMSPDLALEIEGQIKPLLPPYETLIQQIYLWPRNSGISAHYDSHRKFGATLYLNDHWEIDFGGLFIWQDKNSQELRARMPEFNTMVVNDEDELHLVTPIAANCSGMRHTVQIWGH